jgi:hypothetical protein
MSELALGGFFENRYDMSAPERCLMTDQERRDMKARLIELGFWGADEFGNPTVYLRDATTLHQRVDEQLASDMFLVSAMAAKYSSAREVLVFHGGHVYTLVTADNYPEAICLSALALPEFLRMHPECTADRE